jgi:uncharacterized protein (TIGR02996 family)
MSHEAFLQAVRENPDDDTPRLVYADWLDERTRLVNDVLRKVCGRASPAGDIRVSMTERHGVRMPVEDDSGVVDELESGERP